MVPVLRRAGRLASLISNGVARRPGAIFLAVALATIASDVVAARGSTLSNGLELIERNYLFAGELDAPRLLRSALSYLAANLPEVRVLDGKDGGHVLVAGPCRLRLESAPDARVTELEPALRKAGGLVDDCVRDRPEGLPPTESLLVNGVLSGLDPYSTVFDADRKAEHALQFEGTIAGIGARIGIREERLTLIDIYEDSPAARAGLRDGDILRRIDGVSTTNLPVADAVQRVRGKIGSVVQLEMERNGAAPFSATISRDLVTIPSVRVQMLSRGILYTAISHFSQTTPGDFRAQVREVISRGAVRGIIIDLRENSGGSMLASAAIADLFLDAGVLITTAGRNGAKVAGLTAEIRATSDTPFRDYPVAILTSPRTASGSELLAASLRTHDRAVLVGERTFGKGTVQKTYDLGNDCSLKMTVGHFLPNGRSVPGDGLKPDVQVRSFTFAKAGGLELPVARVTANPPFWLRTPAWLTTAVVQPRAVLTYASTSETAQDTPADGRPDDVIATVAGTLLERFGSVSAERSLADAEDWLADRRLEAESGLQGALMQRGVDWRPPRSIASIESAIAPSLRVRVAPRKGSLQAGQTGKIAVMVTNTGSEPLYRIHGRLVSEARFLDGHGLLFGWLAPGATRRWVVTVEPPAAIRTSRHALRVSLAGEEGQLIESGTVYVAVDGADQPRLAHRVAVVGTGKPDSMRLRVEVRNLGEGTVEELRAFLKHPESEAVELVRGSAKLKQLAPGDTSVLEFEARVLQSSDKPIRLDLVLAQEEFRMSVEAQVALTPHEEFSGWQEAPEIRLRRLVPGNEDGVYKVVAEAVDDKGLASMWCRVGGNKVDYVDAADEPRRKLRVDLPWHPSTDVQRVEIVATDSDGTTTTYVTDL